ncbi:sulfurtransferase [Jatrophihabitans sp. YIM 134969]
MIPPFVDLQWVREHPGVVLADARSYLDGRVGRDAWLAGHVPGAVHVDLETDLARHGAPTDGRHPLPSPDDFAAAMASLGIGESDTVVAYDDDGGVIAARLVWMLRVTGHDAALLDGGLAAWDGPLATGEELRPPAAFSSRPWPRESLATIDEVAAGGDFTLLDARAPERYRGEVEPMDPQAGHIPGAVNLPARDWTDHDGRLLDDDTLAERLDAVPGEIVSSCGSGVTACHTLLVLEHAGRTGRLFPGSFSAWSNDPSRPVATG